MADRWTQRREEALDKTLGANDWTGSFTVLTKSFRLYLQSAMLAIGAFFVMRGEMSSGAMVASSIMLGRGLAPVEQTLGQWAMIQRAVGSWRALRRFLAETPRLQRKPNCPAPKRIFRCAGWLWPPQTANCRRSAIFHSAWPQGRLWE